jgi:hypothetical protein
MRVMRWILAQFHLNPYPESTPASAYEFFLLWYDPRHQLMVKGGRFLVPHPYIEGIWKWIVVPPSFDLSYFSAVFWDSSDYRFNTVDNGFHDLAFDRHPLPPWSPRSGPALGPASGPPFPLPKAYGFLNSPPFSSNVHLRAIRKQFPLYDLQRTSTPAIATKRLCMWYMQNSQRFRDGGSFWVPHPFILGFWKLVSVPKISEHDIATGLGKRQLRTAFWSARSMIVIDKYGTRYDLTPIRRTKRVSFNCLSDLSEAQAHTQKQQKTHKKKPLSLYTHTHTHT